MKSLARAVAIAAAGVALAGCIPAAAVPFIQGGAALAVDAFCSPAAAELRADVRSAFYGDPSTSVLSRADCE